MTMHVQFIEGTIEITTAMANSADYTNEEYSYAELLKLYEDSKPIPTPTPTTITTEEPKKRNIGLIVGILITPAVISGVTALSIIGFKSIGNKKKKKK